MGIWLNIKYEYLLSWLIAILVLTAILGIGVALGGGNSPDTTNAINGIIAFFTALSALTTLGTLFLLIMFRNDWKAPKEHDSQLETIVAIKKWKRSVEAINSKISNLSKSHQLPYPMVPYFKNELENELFYEKECWADFEHKFDIYVHYSGKDIALNQVFNGFNKQRNDLRKEIDSLTQQPSILSFMGGGFNNTRYERLVSGIVSDMKRFLKILYNHK